MRHLSIIISWRPNHWTVFFVQRCLSTLSLVHQSQLWSLVQHSNLAVALDTSASRPVWLLTTLATSTLPMGELLFKMLHLFNFLHVGTSMYMYMCVCMCMYIVSSLKWDEWDFELSQLYYHTATAIAVFSSSVGVANSSRRGKIPSTTLVSSSLTSWPSAPPGTDSTWPIVITAESCPTILERVKGRCWVVRLCWSGSHLPSTPMEATTGRCTVCLGERKECWGSAWIIVERSSIHGDLKGWVETLPYYYCL